jgi:NhaA family Na+:H+ antiporter
MPRVHPGRATFSWAWCKPLGILLASLFVIKLRLAVLPDGVTVRNFIGAACLCSVGYTIALLMAHEAFAVEAQSAIAKAGVLLGSTLAGVLGVVVILAGRRVQVSPSVAS